MKTIKFFQILILTLFFKLKIVLGTPTCTDKIIAIVNQNIILDSDITNKINFMKYDILTHNTKTFQKNQLYYTILDQLIIDNLILQMAAKENIKINSTQINQLIEHTANSRNMTINQFYVHLDNIGLNHDKYFSEIYQEILKKIICNQMIYQYMHISSNEIIKIAQKLDFIDFRKRFKLTHILIEELPIQTSSSKINQAKAFATYLIQEKRNYQNLQKIINTYYCNNNDHIFPQINIQNTKWNTWLDIPMIFDQYLKTAKPGDIIGPVHSNDGIHILEIHDICIDKHIAPIIRVKINNIVSREKSNNIYIKQKLLKIKEDIKNKSTTFTILLQEKSKDFYSENYGNFVKWINLNQFDPLIQKTLLTLKKNQISMPIYTNNRWCLIKLIDIDKLNYSEIIYERAYSYILHQKFDEALHNWIQELKSYSYIKIIN